MAGSSRGGIEMDVMFGKGRSIPRPAEDTPFRVLVLAPLSGGKGDGSAKPVRVDVTGLDDLMERFLPKVALDMPDGSIVEVTVEELEDLHPDALFDRLPVFKAMRQLRRELQDPKTFERAVASLRTAPRAQAPESAASEADGDMMQRLLGKAPSPAPQPSKVESLVRDIVAPHIVPGPHPDQAAHLAAMDAGTSDLMRSILHHPRFQRLEAAWRGLDFLLRGVDGDMDVAVIDLDEAGLAEALSSDDPASTPLGRRIVGEAGATEPPWALVVADFTFQDSEADASLAGKLASVLAKAGTPMVAAADPALAREPSPEGLRHWAELRRRPEAAMMGLTLPRFLLRLPYGEQTDEIDRFAFEEQAVPPEPERYLWGNAAWFVACLLGRSFAQRGWDFSAGDTLSIAGLPVHTFRADGESAQTPCAEVWLPQDTAEALLGQGLMPACSVRGRDAVQLLRMQSIAEPAAPLAGRWR